jgi:hypothetical protein
LTTHSHIKTLKLFLVLATAQSSTATWSNFSSNFVTFASQATASIISAVETAEAQVLGNAHSSPRSSIGNISSGSLSAQPAPVPVNNATSNMSYQERQRLLHQQYQASNPAAANNGLSSMVSPSSQASLSAPFVPTTNSSTKTAHITSEPPQPPPNTFLDKLTTNLDTATKTKLIASAVGNLLPGERVIMFLNSLRDVKDSRFPMLMVGSPNVMSSTLKNILGVYDENDFEEGDENGVATVWCCVMTFYRVLVFSYRATVSDGKVLFNESTDGESNNKNKRSSGDKEIIDSWVTSQNVSIQFQVAHAENKQHQKQYHHVFEIPLASIERVEKIMASSQSSIVGVTSTTSSSYSNYQGILPSSSAVSSASSAMSQLGSQMKPLLGSINTNSNMLTNGPSNASSSNMNAMSAPSGPLGIILHGKDGGRWIKFSTNSYSDAMRAHEALNTYAFPGRRNLGYLFAFESRRAEVMAGAQQQQQGEGAQTTAPVVPPTPRRFVAMEEFQRQGILCSRGEGSNETSSPWALITANSNYGLCSSYPSVLVGPRSVVGDDPINATMQESGISLLRRCAAFRSENRFPALTWGSATHGGSIWRSSQPKVGLQGNRSIEDERYLYAIGEEAKRANLAADARVDGGVGGGGGKPPNEFLRMLCGRNNESDLILEGANSSCMLKIMVS